MCSSDLSVLSPPRAEVLHNFVFGLPWLDRERAVEKHVWRKLTVELLKRLQAADGKHLLAFGIGLR